ncbi:MAG: transpeptidase family protein [Bacteroidales bacterium]|nr:transpeptidase family protein [Bacteroidales bacterium]
MAIRDEIVWRSGVVYIVIILLAVAVTGKIIHIQFVEDEKWEAMGENYIYRNEEVPANRGDILSVDGRLLASSIPYYNIYMDTRSSGMESSVWNSGIDRLSAGLAHTVGLKSAAGWKRDLNAARNQGNRYYLIKRRVTYAQFKELKELPVFRHGRYRGGFIAEMESRRILPHISLASRTIGSLNKGESGNVVGLEGAFDRELAGLNGEVLKQRLTGGAWMPVNDRNSVEPMDGNDIVTTIDIELQDVAESALLRQLSLHDAHHGTAILMEVRTGDIRAIANLEIGSDGNYYESYNYAVGESTEPGSTFKLASFIVALEDGFVDLDDTIDTGEGSVKYYDKVITDSHKGGYGRITVKEVFENSSNVGTAKIIYDNYRANPEKFVDRLYRMGLNEKLGIEIRGEGAPLIRYPGDAYWSGISLPMMSHGYEIQMTPLQVLTFYNAVANNGRMVKPRLVSEIRYHGETVSHIPPAVINPSIASRSTIEKARILLEGVVENGTATNLFTETYRIAGKTGTAQIANEKYGYRMDGRISYQASFVGYFPAEDPVYSCIVVVNAPSNWVYYGNQVAGPVFKEIADKVYATSFYNDYPHPDSIVPVAPSLLRGETGDVVTLLASLGIPSENEAGTDWVVPVRDSGKVLLRDYTLIENLVPDVTGMGLRDALFLLENAGMHVETSGRGRIVQQSVRPGTRIIPGSVITLELQM